MMTALRTLCLTALLVPWTGSVSILHAGVGDFLGTISSLYTVGGVARTFYQQPGV